MEQCAWRLMNIPHVKAAIQKAQENAVTQAGISFASQVEPLKNDARVLRSSGDYKAAAQIEVGIIRSMNLDRKDDAGGANRVLKIVRVFEKWWAMLGSNQRPLPCEDTSLHTPQYISTT